MNMIFIVLMMANFLMAQRHATERIIIEGKSVSELTWYRIPETQIYDDKYAMQIIAQVE